MPTLNNNIRGGYIKQRFHLSYIFVCLFVSHIIKLIFNWALHFPIDHILLGSIVLPLGYLLIRRSQFTEEANTTA